MKDDQSSLGGGVHRFQTTRWSVVLVSAQSPLLAEAMDRLRKQYTATVREEISRTVSAAADVDTETHELCEALTIDLQIERQAGKRSLSGADAERQNEKAIDLFKQAIDADPKFALAYTGLADAYIERVQRFHGEDFWSDSAVDLCQRAVALDPKEVRSYTELARALLNKGWHERAHEPIRKALELNPNDWRANRFAADELFGTARYDEMYVYLRKCYAVNPNDSYAPNLMGYICWIVDQNDLAEKWMQRAINVETGPQARLLMQCELSILQGDYAAATPGLEQLPPGFYGYTFSASGLLIDCLVHQKDWSSLLQLIAVLKQSGDSQKGRNPATLLMPEAIGLRALRRETEARQTAERCETIARDDLTMKKFDGHWNHWLLAFCARFLGRKEEAYQHVRESFANGDVAFLGWLPDSPSLQIFKPDPEFQDILAERNKQNAGKRARILATEKSYQK